MAIKLLEEIRERLAARPLQKHILLCRSFAQGHQLIERMTREMGPIANLEVATVESLALELAGLALDLAGKQVVDRGRGLWLVHAIMHELAQEADPYIPDEMIQPGVVASMHRSILELRNAKVSADDLRPDMFVEVRKGRYLIRVLHRYEEELAKRQLVDFAGLLCYIRPATGDEAIHLIALPDAIPSRVAQLIVQKIAGQPVVPLEPASPFYEAASGFPCEQTEMFHAFGSIAESRELLRRILAARIPLDQVEIIASDYETYAGVFHTLASTHNLGCTFAEGLPLETSAAGRVALQFLDWLEHDFPVELILQLLREGILSFRGYDEEGYSSLWVGILEKLGIGWSKERYELLLLPDHAETGQNRAVVTALQRAFRHIWEKVPDPTHKAWDICSVLTAVAWFVQRFSRIRTPEDTVVLSQLKEEAEAMQGIPVVPMSHDLAIRYAREKLQSIRTSVSPLPAPGKLHISSLSSGGWSGRNHTYLVGMEEKSWTTASRQDPLLLDQERVSISEWLPTSAVRSEQMQRERDGRLGIIRGNVTLSYASYDAAEKKTVTPAFELLQVFRLQTREWQADFARFREALGQQTAYWSADPPTYLDRVDVWARELRGTNLSAWKDGHLAMERIGPHLGEGRKASEARVALDLSEFDGWLSLSPEGERQVSTPISASRLEHYARCPLKFWFSYELGLWPKEQVVYDRSLWLKPDEKGNLLHHIFYQYLTVASRDAAGAIIHDRAMLDELTEAHLEDYARKIPAPSPHVYEKECRELREDVEVFYRRELGCKDVPLFFEQELSLDGEPLALHLEEGLTVRIKGFVDRIDRIGPHCYRILDYKTGNPSKYRENEYFSGGTQLQHALYASAAEEWLRQTGFDPEAKVTESVYLFPTVRGRGEQVVRLQTKRMELAYVISRILASMQSGVYVPTQDVQACTWCDYQRVCGRHAEYMTIKRTWEGNQQALEALLEVEGLD